MNNFVTTQKKDDISQWFRSICNVTVGDVTRSSPGVLALHFTTPVSEVLNTLEELEIQSVAIFSPPNSFIGAGGVNAISEDQQIIGIVSMLDVLAFSLKHEDYLTHHVCDVIGSTNESLTLWVEDSKKPLYFAMEQFIKGVHHALVQESADSAAPLKYLAQSDIVRYLVHHTDAFPSLELLLVQPVEVVTTCYVVPVLLSAPLTDAIALLVEHGALPVVNDAGVVVSNLSASDFKGKSTTALRATPGVTVQDLLCHQAMCLDEMHRPLTVHFNASLLDAARIMLSHSIHRLWVVPSVFDEGGGAVDPIGQEVLFEGLGVITLTDILRAVYISEAN